MITNVAVPVEVMVTDCETAVPTDTVPKERELVLTLTAGVPEIGGERAILNVSIIPFAWAVIIAV